MASTGYLSLRFLQFAAVPQCVDGCIRALALFSDSTKECGIVKTGNLGDVGNGHAFASEHHRRVAAPVVALRATRRPSAIRRFVVSVCVDAIKRRTNERPLTHVGEEGFVRVAPSVAHLDSAPAVISVVLAAWVAATVLHKTPDATLASQFAAARLPVFGASLHDAINVQATATLGLTRSKQVSVDDGRASAVTPAAPHGLDSVYIRTALNDQSAEPLANKVYKSRHPTIITSDGWQRVTL